MGARGLRSAWALAMTFETTNRVRALSNGFARKGNRILQMGVQIHNYYNYCPFCAFPVCFFNLPQGGV